MKPHVFEWSVVPFVLSHPAAGFTADMNPHIALFKRKHDTTSNYNVLLLASYSTCLPQEGTELK